MSGTTVQAPCHTGPDHETTEPTIEPAETETTEEDDWLWFRRMFAPHPPYRPSDDHSYVVGSLVGGHS